MSFIRSYLWDTLEKIRSTFDCLLCLFDEFVFFCNSCFMPELPEVETVKVFLEKNVVNEKTKSVKIENENLRFVITTNVSQILSNSIITKILRRGKYLLFLYNNNFTLLFHLGMTGFFRIERKYESRKHDHLIFNFAKKKLIFNDVRKFGFVKIFNAKEIFNCSHLKNLGPEPLSSKFCYEYFKNNLNRKTNIKNLLMNQSFVAGLGNIYCSEILFRSNIKPIRPINLIKDYEIIKIVNSVKKILLNSIKLGGTTIKNFVVSDEKIGYFKNKLMVYGRNEMSCLKCKNKIAKITLSGRSTFFCSQCQK